MRPSATRACAVDERWADAPRRGDLAGFHDAWEAQPMFASRADLPDDVAGAPARRPPGRERRGGSPRSLRGAGQGVMPPTPGPAARRSAHLRSSSRATSTRSAESGPRRSRRLLPSARLELVADAGHAPHLERPEAFLSLVIDFLAHPPADTTGGAAMSVTWTTVQRLRGHPLRALRHGHRARRPSTASRCATRSGRRP